MTASGQTRAAILTVDDDSGVSRSVARDLRRQYGEDYRIVRAESGQQALDALREMKLRGDQVAVLLADYRMPQMNGIEFLEQAMHLYPYARRVPLTAYADTDAAISVINEVDLDYYLLKPWDPSEEKLAAGRDRRHRPGRPRKHPAANIRTVLHHQCRRRGHRPRAGHLVAHHRQQAPRRPAGRIRPR